MLLEVDILSMQKYEKKQNNYSLGILNLFKEYWRQLQAVDNEYKLYSAGILTCAIFVFILFSAASFNNIEPRSEVFFSKRALPRLLMVKADRMSLPQEVRGIYISAYTASDKVRREKLFKMIDDTELNSVVIDVKDSTGHIFFDAHDPLLVSSGAIDARIKDFDDILVNLHDRGIWTIARIVVFQDPKFADARPDLAVHSASSGKAWRDRKGLRWMDPSSKDVWDYNAALARETIVRGFDEVQFDYVRFPSDGNIADMRFPVWDAKVPKYEVLKQFFQYMDKSLAASGGKLSVDLFGLTFSRADKPNDDLNIGQRVIDALHNVDFISPMVYPSHYPPTFQGYANPAEHPYQIVNFALKGAAKLFTTDTRAKSRPWLQDFNLGANYTTAMVKDQIRAARENNASGWLLWNPSNVYTVGALEKEPKPNE